MCNVFLLCINPQTTITWDGDKLVCVQKGEIEGRGWTHWIEGDELHLVTKLHLKHLFLDTLINSNFVSGNRELVTYGN